MTPGFDCVCAVNENVRVAIGDIVRHFVKGRFVMVPLSTVYIGIVARVLMDIDSGVQGAMMVLVLMFL